MKKTLLWWGRFDPDYSRNRVLQSLFENLGWNIAAFHPSICRLGALEAVVRNIETPDLVWVPCFRQRDIKAARSWSRARKIPLVIDPLISAYDKQVFERQKFAAHGARAYRLLKWEASLFQSADLVVADTCEHARFFTEALGVPQERCFVLPVGAEEALFFPEVPETSSNREQPVEILFYGSFIPLQGPQVIMEAARRYKGPPVLWRFIGHGPLLEVCKTMVATMENVVFEPWVPYTELPAKIRHADILLGIFGETPKTGRVIPNKVFQAMACGKPVVTSVAKAYPQELINQKESGISWIPAGDPDALADMVTQHVAARTSLEEKGNHARQSYDRYFSRIQMQKHLQELILKLEASVMTKNNLRRV